jgi:hypothetical protein
MISVKTSFLNFFEARASSALSIDSRRARSTLSIGRMSQLGALVIESFFKGLVDPIAARYSVFCSLMKPLNQQVVTNCSSVRSRWLFLTSAFTHRTEFSLILFVFAFLALNPKVVRAQMIGGVDMFSAPGSSAAQSAYHFELSQNPAGISGNDITWSGLRLFGMSELESVGFSGSYVGKRANFAIELHRFGFDLYQENNVIIGSSIKIQSDTRLGLGIGYQQVGIKGYGSSGVEYINLGVIHQFSDKLSMGGAVRNLVLNRHGSFRVGLQSDILFGASYSALDQLSVHLGFLKSPSFDTQVLMGFSWQPVEAFKLMGGYITVSEEWSVSAAVTAFGLEIRYGAREHQVLGWSQGIALTYLW